MSFLSKLFGGGKQAEAPGAGAATAKVHSEVEHKGFMVRATPYKEAGQFQTAGTVSHVANGTTRTHRFIRADRFGSADEAAEFALVKGRQLVDEQGERLFDERV